MFRTRRIVTRPSVGVESFSGEGLEYVTGDASAAGTGLFVGEKLECVTGDAASEDQLLGELEELGDERPVDDGE